MIIPPFIFEEAHKHKATPIPDYNPDMVKCTGTIGSFLSYIKHD